MSDISILFQKQFHDWEMLNRNYAALKSIKAKEFKIDSARFKVQFNPARIISSSAKVDEKSIKERRCFLCSENRPEEQAELDWNNDYTILINPYPIFPRHLTIPSKQHEPQRISGRIAHMMNLAAYLDDFTIFYNGPRCGASAPDHAHFQAGNKGFLPFEKDYAKGKMTEIKRIPGAAMFILSDIARIAFMIQADNIEAGEKLFNILYQALPMEDIDVEPMLNILCWNEKGKWIIAVFPRIKHRPTCYFADGNNNLLITPASVDMGGVFITPLEKDFNKVTAYDIKNILDEVCISQETACHIIERIRN